jgi:uncharacterized membrane protein YjdF
MDRSRDPPVDRFDWLLENLLVFVAVPALIASHRRCALSAVSYGLDVFRVDIEELKQEIDLG